MITSYAVNTHRIHSFFFPVLHKFSGQDVRGTRTGFAWCQVDYRLLLRSRRQTNREDTSDKFDPSLRRDDYSRWGGFSWHRPGGLLAAMSAGAIALYSSLPRHERTRALITVFGTCFLIGVYQRPGARNPCPLLVIISFCFFCSVSNQFFQW